MSSQQTDMTRDELRNSLAYIQSKIWDILQLYNKESLIELNFRNELEHIEKIKTSGTKAKTKIGSITGIIIAYILSLFICFLSGFFYVILMLVLGFLCFDAYKKSKKSLLPLSILLGLYVLLCLSRYARSGILGIIIILTVIILVTISIANYIKSKNKRIDRENEKIDNVNYEIQSQNSYYLSQYNQIEAQINSIKAELYNNTISWYPRDYYVFDIVTEFIRYLDNMLCDTMKECVQYYEKSTYRQQVLANQEAMRRDMNDGFSQVLGNQERMLGELRTANILSAMNVAATLSVRDAVNRGNSEVVDAVNRGSRNIAESVNQGSQRVSDAVNNSRR